MHAANRIARTCRLYDERTPERAHFERMLTYVICASVLVLPLAMAPINAFFAHVVYRVSETAPGYPIHVDDSVYPVLDVTSWPFLIYWLFSIPLWVALLAWAVFMTASARDGASSRGWRWLVIQCLLLYIPFVLFGVALVVMREWGVVPD